MRTSVLARTAAGRSDRDGASRSAMRPALGLLLVSLAALSMTGCAWLGLSGNAEPPAPEISSSREVESVPTRTDPGRLFLMYKDGDFTGDDLTVPAGNYEIEVFNFNNPRPIGFFLREPDRYGRELNHLATGGGIEMGEGRVFTARLTAGTTYYYSCPVTQSSDHLISAVAVSLSGDEAAEADAARTAELEAAEEARANNNMAPGREIDLDALDTGDDAEETTSDDAAEAEDSW